MGLRWVPAVMLLGFLSFPPLTQASTGDIGTIIEKFVIRQFPNSVSHYWVINETTWDGDEMVIDMHTIVKDRVETDLVLSRFLLLIVSGEIRGAQNIPLEPGTECRPEEEV